MGAMHLKSPASPLITQPFITTDQRKHQSSTALAFARGIHRWPLSNPLLDNSRIVRDDKIPSNMLYTLHVNIYHYHKLVLLLISQLFFVIYQEIGFTAFFDTIVCASWKCWSTLKGINKLFLNYRIILYNVIPLWSMMCEPHKPMSFKEYRITLNLHAELWRRVLDKYYTRTPRQLPRKLFLPNKLSLVTSNMPSPRLFLWNIDSKKHRTYIVCVCVCVILICHLPYIDTLLIKKKLYISWLL